MSTYDFVTQDMFDAKLADIAGEESIHCLLGIEGVYAALSEHFNNEVLDALLEEHQKQQREKELEERNARWDVYGYTIAEYWVPYLFNGDASGLSDKEAAQVEAFETKVIAECGPGHWAYPLDAEDEEPGLQLDDVTPQWANCVTLDYLVEKEDV